MGKQVFERKCHKTFQKMPMIPKKSKAIKRKEKETLKSKYLKKNLKA